MNYHHLSSHSTAKSSSLSGGRGEGRRRRKRTGEGVPLPLFPIVSVHWNKIITAIHCTYKAELHIRLNYRATYNIVPYLPSVPRNCSTQCYVDDTKLQISFKMRDCPTAMNDLNSDLLLIRNWCFNNFLLLNPDKTKLVVFGSRQLLAKLPDFKISLLGKDLAEVCVSKSIVPAYSWKGTYVSNTP